MGMTELVELLARARAYDLAQPYFIGMPHHPVHPPYLFSLVKKHGDYATREGTSSASEALALDCLITPEQLDAAARAEGVEVRAGDVVLVRTGWARFWEDAARYICQVKGPGPGAPGARWLSERGIFAAGSDTVAFEKVPDPEMPVHVQLLVERGIHIIEWLNMERLAEGRVYEYVFVALTLGFAVR